MSQVTTHILDTSKGQPAAQVKVVLFEQQSNGWNQIGSGITNADGRVADLLTKDMQLEKGIYKLWFDTKSYFETRQVKTFYPFVEIVFEIQDSQHYHVPLLLNPFGYSTYRGS